MRDWPLWEVFVRSRRGLSHVHVGSLHAPDAEMALRNARDVYTRRQEGVSHLGACRPPRSSRPTRRRRTRSSTPPPTRSTGTRRSTTSRTGWSTCERAVRRSRRSYVLGLADDALVSAQRLGSGSAARRSSRRTSRSRNIGLDLLGQARTLLVVRRLASRAPAAPRTTSPTCATTASSATSGWSSARNGDFGVTMARLLLFSAYQLELYAALAACDRRDARRRSPARRSRRSPTTSTTPRSGWCGSATAPTSRTRRMQAALDAVWPYVDELFAPAVDGAGRCRGRRRPGPAAAPCSPRSRRSLAEATLTVPQVAPARGGGRRGLHTEELGYLLAEMQHLHRSHPGATW